MPLTFSPRANTASPAALVLTAALMPLSWSVAHSGHIHARKEIDDVKAGTNGDFDLSVPGEDTVDTLYTSYRFPNVMYIENFDIYLGAYYSRVDHKEVDNLDDADRYGGRLRFKYLF